MRTRSRTRRRRARRRVPSDASLCGRRACAFVRCSESFLDATTRVKSNSFCDYPRDHRPGHSSTRTSTNRAMRTNVSVSALRHSPTGALVLVRNKCAARPHRRQAARNAHAVPRRLRHRLRGGAAHRAAARSSTRSAFDFDTLLTARLSAYCSKRRAFDFGDASLPMGASRRRFLRTRR